MSNYSKHKFSLGEGGGAVEGETSDWLSDPPPLQYRPYDRGRDTGQLEIAGPAEARQHKSTQVQSYINERHWSIHAVSDETVSVSYVPQHSRVFSHYSRPCTAVTAHQQRSLQH